MDALSPRSSMISPMSFFSLTRTTSYIFASAMFSATMSGPDTFTIFPCIPDLDYFFFSSRGRMSMPSARSEYLRSCSAPYPSPPRAEGTGSTMG